ncbi:MAG: GGDEF domain-containing protein [Oscillospiraceae bacterium]|nr:GGDEF domain-containing protein [Oscillospiraceae bacterium]
MKKRKKIKGLRLSVFNTAIVLISCVLYISLLIATTVASKNYEQLVHTADAYIRLEDAAKDVLRASDYLTEQVRLYTQSLDPQYARLYFKEANVTQRRECALELIREYSIDPSGDEALERAVESSEELIVRELYAIALIASAQGHDANDLGAQLDDDALDDADQRLTPSQKINKARGMLFDQKYQDTKNKIYRNLDFFTGGVLYTTQDHLVSGLSDLSHSIRNQRILLTVLIILNCVTFFVITFLVVKPLKVFLQCVQERSMFKVTGAYEFRYLAQVYNEIWTRSDALAASEAFLRTKAERDALTAIFNRYMFQRVCELLKDSEAPLGLVIIDVDKFKEVNDTYGHSAGDRALIRVAQVLTECFRDSDHVFRIGGDEFAAILPTVNPGSGERIREKLRHVNKLLSDPGDGAIPLTLSCGVAFSPAGYRDSLLEQADRAMYVVKQNGRNDCLIYTEDMAAEK